jgi:hypothetical protein
MSRLAIYPVEPVTRISGFVKESSFLSLLSSQERHLRRTAFGVVQMGKKKEG